MTSLPSAGRLAWYANRLRCMSAGELVYRLRQAGVARLERSGLLSLAAPPPKGQLWGLPPASAPPLAPGESEALLADARRIAAGEVCWFGSHHLVGAMPSWNRAQGGDIKHIWELNRHLHLVRLAQAWRVSGNAEWLEVLRAQVSGWLEQCPPLTGPNWKSPLELGIRLVSWTLVWQLAGGAEGPLFAGERGQWLRRTWLDSIHAHCQCIARRLSRHSSANNHLIVELAGLFVASTAWPCWPQSAHWRDQARRELEREAQAQFTHDGVNREQAFAYHVFSCELLCLAALAGAAAGRPFSSQYHAVIASALGFLRAVRDVGGNVPQVGDADDGAAWRLDPASNDRPGLLLSLGAAMAGAPPESATARWLLHAFPGPPCAMPAQEDGWAFRAGGYLLFGCGFGEPREIKGIVDCGPLGYLGIAAHGHADALSLSLSVAGEPCLVDPGTYSYWREQAWRDYFRGTSAHNTVRVDGADQSVSGGRFMWLRKARTRVDRMPGSPGQFDFRGSHDGYLRLADPARHVREVKFDDESMTLTVTDRIEARAPHRVEQFWHFAPQLSVVRSGNRVRVRGKRFGMELTWQGEGIDVELVRGQENPPLGWFSPGYEQKEPCTVAKITTNSSGDPVKCRFTISFSQCLTEG